MGGGAERGKHRPSYLAVQEGGEGIGGLVSRPGRGEVETWQVGADGDQEGVTRGGREAYQVALAPQVGNAQHSLLDQPARGLASRGLQQELVHALGRRARPGQAPSDP